MGQNSDYKEERERAVNQWAIYLKPRLEELYDIAFKAGYHFARDGRVRSYWELEESDD